MSDEWATFHEDVERVSEDGDCSEEHQDGKEEGADRVNNLPFWLKKTIESQ
jgi:hypothetical protein